MGKWRGNYEDTREGKQSLEDNLLDAMDGKYCYPTSDGGTVRINEREKKMDVYFPSDSDRGHSHDWYDGKTKKTGHHD